MDDLDFSGLTDDQIAGLAAALAQEALRRSPAMAAAFEQALRDERQKAEAMLKGQEKARGIAAEEVEDRAFRAELEVKKEELKKKTVDAMRQYLIAAATILDKDYRNITLVWIPPGNGVTEKLCINAGSTGMYTYWHLFKYEPRTEGVYASPAAKRKLKELHALGKEVIAAIRASKFCSTLVIKGIEL